MTRHEEELDTLEQISQILGEGLDLRQTFGRAMSLLGQRMHMQRAALGLLDRATDQIRTIAGVGLTQAEQERGRYAIGEGITGRVLQSGQPAIIADVASHPDFLNRTGARKIEPGSSNDEPSASRLSDSPLAFLCIPIRDGDECVGVISVDKPFEGEERLQADARLLKIVAGSIAQSLRIHHLVQLEKDQWLAENQRLRDNLGSKYRFDNIIGSSQAMLDVLATVGQVATSRATCLILGETGCGKELIAKAIHYNSPRRDRPLIRVNCGALSPQLLESELFGHVKGAFTGAVRDKVGRFEAADGGTIFLDEVGTLSPELQVKLLRVLQERELERVGEHESIRIDVRVIAATNLELEKEVKNGDFREDLYYRLNVVTIHVPPLRQRREDIPQLTDHFLDRYNAENSRNLKRISRDVMNTLLRYPWPGNVRELENAVERAVVLSTGEDLLEDLLPLQIRLFMQQTRGGAGEEGFEALASKLAVRAVREFGGEEGKVYSRTIDEVERCLIREALDRNEGVKLRAADFLGINRNTLNKKVKDLKIETAEG